MCYIRDPDQTSGYIQMFRSLVTSQFCQTCQPNVTSFRNHMYSVHVLLFLSLNSVALRGFLLTGTRKVFPDVGMNSRRHDCKVHRYNIKRE